MQLIVSDFTLRFKCSYNQRIAIIESHHGKFYPL